MIQRKWLEILLPKNRCKRGFQVLLQLPSCQKCPAKARLCFHGDSNSLTAEATQVHDHSVAITHGIPKGVKDHMIRLYKSGLETASQIKAALYSEKNIDIDIQK